MSKPPSSEIPPRILVAHILLLTMAVAPHAQNLSLWLVGFYFILAGLRLMVVRQPGNLPGRFLLFLLTIGGVTNVFMHQSSGFVKDTAVGMLGVALGLKLRELRQRRDIYLPVLLGYFLIITQFLYSQSMALTAYLALTVFGLTTVLIEVNHVRPTARPYFSLRKALVLLGQSLPIMVVMFLLFPRLSGPLWNLGLDQSSAVTGLSGSISPGSISSLSRSRAVAFRVKFNGPVPEPVKRYWRGPVLWETDGRNWESGTFVGNGAVSYRPKGEAIEYEVTMEPSRQSWLFSLDLPADIPANSSILPDYQILRNNPISHRIHYKQRSYLEYSTGEIKPEERQQGLRLPPNITPRMRWLVNRWTVEASTQQDIVLAALGHFHQEEFIYTLSPPLLGANPADEFLFETRRGFCEHYATSFTLLMRLAGIPARVVAGYQGGEMNPHGDYMIVRQSDAHAWAEVWLEGQGWTRIDPTAAVAPERVERPIDVDALAEGAPVQFELIDPGPIANLIKQLALGADAINATWHRWVLGYSNKRQSQMLSMLGLDFLKGTALGIGMVVISSLVVLIITIGILRKSNKATDPIVKIYQLFCRKLARRQLGRREHEGPRDYSQRVIRRRPDLRDPVSRIIDLYIGLRYGRVDSTANRKYLKKLVRNFNP